MADFQNYKGRIEREKGDLRKFVTRRRDPRDAPVLDNLERAVSAAPEGVGVRSSTECASRSREFHRVLEQHGVRPVEDRGREVRPLPDGGGPDGPETTKPKRAPCSTSSRRATELDDFVIRPARVSVAGAKKTKADVD